MRLQGVGSNVPNALFDAIGFDGWSMVIAQPHGNYFFTDASRIAHVERLLAIQESLVGGAKSVADSMAVVALPTHRVAHSIF